MSRTAKSRSPGVIARAAAVGALMALMPGMAAQASETAAVDDCVVIDTDFDIDDMMAIPMVIGNRHVAAIITTEGYTMADAGAAALSRLIAEPNERHVPVIIGAETHRSDADIRRNWPWLPYVRVTMARANDWLAAAPTPASEPRRDFVADMARATADCRRIDVLLLGAYSSFIAYSPVLGSRLQQVVAMGRPMGDPTLKPGKTSFNCGYDLLSCQTAMAQLAAVRTSWVDIPRDTDPVYAPSLAMVERLGAEGLPATLKAALMANPHTWDPEKVPVSAGGPGGASLMWDQSAALYLLHPDLFGPVGHHYEPLVLGGSHAVTRERLLDLWTEDTNAARSFQ